MTAWLAVGALMVPPPAGAQEEVAQAPAKPAPAPYTGMKKRIAVAKFDAGGTYAAQVGKLIDAQMLIVGSVTEFEQAEKGSGLGIGLSGPLAGIGLGGKVVEGHVGMDIRLVDTTTGQVLTSKRAEARVSASDVSLTISTRDADFGGDAFNKTPLGQARRSAIEEAVALIVGERDGP
jgi:curli biogenesis system outer membrane secretion channel CsgG